MKNRANLKGTSLPSSMSDVQSNDNFLPEDVITGIEQAMLSGDFLVPEGSSGEQGHADNEASSSVESPSTGKKSVTVSRTHKPVVVLGVIDVTKKDGRVFHLALTTKGVFFVGGEVPKEFPCYGFLEKRVADDGSVYKTVYISPAKVEQVKKYSNLLNIFSEDEDEDT